ncbi:lipocalin-like domain-containing protein [Rhodoferax sp.]|uniref:lipocalin-like domain-containing protein n=1 Tax=Rhodoferax sp. TaxID=50421 RepID=UPI00263367E1|nr:lipocalin-like domain-containing protein [Rhodoferax sp.]MDD5479527.1 lipocalin-like domain-containing protein [Rhodoferax sp.]
MPHTPKWTPRVLQFPRDLGSHPDTAIEWWYVTGQLKAGAAVFGFQLTFFRSRVPSTQTMTSAFAAKQLVFAHAAVTDVTAQQLWHDQRIARSTGAISSAVDLAHTRETDTDIQLSDWTLTRDRTSYQAQASAADFAFDLRLLESQPLLLQGDQGWSRKGPAPHQASFYYTLPQLQASGTLQLAGRTLQVQGTAWLDHEWSQSLMPPDAVGWDWLGMNLTDGSALTAYRLRSQQGDTVWAGGSVRAADQVAAEVMAASDVVFTPGRLWKSPHSGSVYPVEWGLQITRRPLGAPAVTERYQVKAMVDNQELDSRQSTGAVYWEGLSQLLDAHGRVLGQGYLEMTGYAGALRL